MRSLLLRASIGLVLLFVAMAGMVFLAAGTLHYWQGWAFLACYFAASIVISLDLAQRDPALLARRMRGGPLAEKEPAQKLIMTFASAGFVALLLVPGLDHRFGWSHMPAAGAIAGNLILLLGWAGIFRVFRENSFTSSTIELAADQRVISTGPYAIVRHPMYVGAMLMFLGIPVALGSWWGVLVVLLVLPAMIWRLVNEERFLASNLPGYVAYQEQVHYRLLPGIW